MSLIASDHFRIVVGLGKSGMSLVRYLARRGLPFASPSGPAACVSSVPRDSCRRRWKA